MLATSALARADPPTPGSVPVPAARILLLGLTAITQGSPPIDPADRYAIGVALADSSLVGAALRDPGWPAPLRAWLRARELAQASEWLGAAVAAREAHAGWRADSTLANEPALVVAQLDRDAVRFALESQDSTMAQTLLAAALADHTGDARWRALAAACDRACGRGRRAREGFDSAWTQADETQRRDAIFAGRALAYADAGDSLAAGQAWLEFARGLRLASEQRGALAVWDGSAQLRRAADRPATRLPVARWLAGLVRREEALALALSAWRHGDARESAAGFVEAAEQLYKMRRHDELAQHLARRWPRALDKQERAMLAAYPWDVERRVSPTLRVAHGFDDVAARFGGCDRGGEALWEAAWVWELAGQPAAAQRRYLRYLKLHPRGPYAEGSALRAIYLPFAAGHPLQALERFRAYRGLLHGEMEDACALWIAARAAQQLPDTTTSRSLWAEIAGRYGDSPLAGPLPRGGAPPVAVDGPMIAAAAESLVQRQALAFAGLAAEVGDSSLARRAPAALVGIERLLRLGLFEEGERELLSWAAVRRADARAQLAAAAVAWRTGRGEPQVRLVGALQGLLAARLSQLRDALRVAAMPTPYADAVLQAAGVTGVPAPLLWGLMRRESLFDAGAISLAGAHGLMQVMPTTAARVAQGWGMPAPASPLLRQPALNVRMGSEEVGRLLRRYEGDPYRALAAYNAGEPNAERWEARRGPHQPTPEYLLLVSFTETRQYIFYVLSYARSYERAYPVLACGQPRPATP